MEAMMDDMRGHVGIVMTEEEFELPIEKHTADSKWQFCKCKTCQRKRKYLDSLPGTPIDYATFRHKDERY
jgi:hypothetical protein